MAQRVLDFEFFVFKLIHAHNMFKLASNHSLLFVGTRLFDAAPVINYQIIAQAVRRIPPKHIEFNFIRTPLVHRNPY